MKHLHGGGRHRHHSPDGAHERDGRDTPHFRREEFGHEGHRHHGRHGGRRRGGRLFDYGELRLVVLGMIGDEPRHGYELIRAIEERMGGSYAPSPGVMYPTLAWLEDMGYALAETEESGRKRYRITPQGQAFLNANRAALDDVSARIGEAGKGGRYDGVPAPVLRGMENLKLAMRLRLRRGPLDAEAAEKIAALLDAAAQGVERS